MLTIAEVKFIKKAKSDDPHNCIQGIGVAEADGIPWYLSRERAIARIEAGTLTLWTMGGGKRAEVIVAEHLGHKYLKTEADGIHTNNLLELPPWLP